MTIDNNDKNLYCAPHITKQKKELCYNRQQLKNIIQQYDQNQKQYNSISKEKLSKKIKQITKCNNDLCILQTKKIQNDQNLQQNLKKQIRPIAPDKWHKNPKEWLTNEDICLVLQQYEKKNKNFHFLGVFPSNFDIQYNYSLKNQCIYETACKLSYKYITNKQQNLFGAVFNTSLHHQKGAHWIALFGFVKKTKIIYVFYDSTGQKANKHIFRFINKIHQTSQKKGILISNKYQHQKGDTECGVFCIIFILCMLKIKNKSEEKIIQVLNNQQLFNDQQIFLHRNKLFLK